MKMENFNNNDLFNIIFKYLSIEELVFKIGGLSKRFRKLLIETSYKWKNWKWKTCLKNIDDKSSIYKYRDKIQSLTLYVILRPDQQQYLKSLSILGNFKELVELELNFRGNSQNLEHQLNQDNKILEPLKNLTNLQRI